MLNHLLCVCVFGAAGVCVCLFASCVCLWFVGLSPCVFACLCICGCVRVVACPCVCLSNWG